MTRLKRVARLERSADVIENDLSHLSGEQLVQRILFLADELGPKELCPETAAKIEGLRQRRRTLTPII